MDFNIGDTVVCINNIEKSIIHDLYTRLPHLTIGKKYTIIKIEYIDFIDDDYLTIINDYDKESFFKLEKFNNKFKKLSYIREERLNLLLNSK